MMVWVKVNAGVRRYVDDRMISPCRVCGEWLSVCWASKCDGSRELEVKK
jgi:hypothetical protein